MAVNTSSAWQSLREHCDSGAGSVHLKDLFKAENRTQDFSLELDEMYVDFSKNRITQETLDLLLNLAKQQGVEGWIKKLLTGKKVNDTEDRAVLHTALRAKNKKLPGFVGSVQSDISSQFSKMEAIVHKIRTGHWRGFSGKPITDVVNIGVGGSDLGPLMITHGLQTTQSPINMHFISSIDGTQTSNVLKSLKQETTLFILASKSFATIDTLSNAETAKDWLRESIKDEATLLAQHFLGVSTKPDMMASWGIPPENQLVFWDWVGGRYSLWSTIGVSIALQIGMKKFYEMLDGAHIMDEHFGSAPLSENIPVILGLIDVWNINFLDIHDKAILPYDARLKYLPSYFEQLIMESNGKSVNRDGERVTYKTCPIVWGEVGSNAQHAFYQLLHQGTQAVMCDFIAPIERDDFDMSSHAEKDESLLYQHELAMANCFAQSRVLMLGDAAIPDSLKESFNSLFKHYPGNQPSNTILLKSISPKTLGMLVALYEHKTFVEGIIWEINSFDQWGVELGKLIAQEAHAAIKSPALASSFDSSTQALIKRILK